MVEIKENYSILEHNTFHIDQKVKFFAEIKSIEDLREIFKDSKYTNLQKCVLGKGANTLFVGDFDGIDLHIDIPGREFVKEDNDYVYIKAGAGEDWPEFVKYTVDNNWGGLQNLAMIPGTVGAAPIQNIAAYGATVEESFEELEAYEIKTGEIKTFDKNACGFKYRTSIFKYDLREKYIVLNVTFKLQKPHMHQVTTEYYSRYESLIDFMKKDIGEPPYTIQDMYKGVCEIRKIKLPAVEEIGSVGSYYTNPIIKKEQLEDILKKFPGIQYYPVDKMQYPKLDSEALKDQEYIKIPAGWILEELGWKGKKMGNAQVFPNHALILTNPGGATSQEIYELGKAIEKDFFEKTGVEIAFEVNIVKNF